jgi:hypothetical protein
MAHLLGIEVNTNVLFIDLSNDVQNVINGYIEANEPSIVEYTTIYPNDAPIYPYIKKWFIEGGVISQTYHWIATDSAIIAIRIYEL